MTFTLFDSKHCEVLINFMYSFVSRFIHSRDESTIASLDNILGGPGWYNRLDNSIPPGPAVEKLFRQTLKDAGGFQYVVSTRIDKPTENRPHFFLAYATKHREGLKAFRESEYSALKLHARNRANALERKRDSKSGTTDLFPGLTADLQQASFEQIVEEQARLGSQKLLELLQTDSTIPFPTVVDKLLEAFVLRETNVKDVCCKLAAEGKIVRSWGTGNRKPNETTLITRI